MDEMKRDELNTIGLMWTKLGDGWKPSLTNENREALMNDIARGLLMYSKVSASGSKKVSLVSDDYPPFILEVTQDGATEKWGIKCSFMGASRWLGGLTHPSYPSVKAAFDNLVADVRVTVSQKGAEENPADPEAQWSEATRHDTYGPSPRLVAQGDTPPPMLGHQDIVRWVANLRPPGVLKICLFGAVCAGVLALAFISEHDRNMTPGPAPVAQSSSSGGTAQVIGASGQTLPSVQSVLQGKTPTIPIPGGGTITDKEQFKVFGMTPGPEIARYAQTNPQV